ncbi:MAG: hypothetical protein HPY62_08800 [Bacteroidales bacterium]|nr:hypothetical protein [Bacteroidales bacterium]
MERTIYRLIILAFLLTGFTESRADYRTEIYNSYVNNRMDLWKNLIERLEAEPQKTTSQLAELVNYQYGYIGYCLGFKKRDEAKKYLDLAEKNTGILEKRGYDPSMVNAYKCAFYGFRIGLNRLSAPVNGLKSIEHAKSALELDKNNYFAYIQYGNIQFYMPPAFGGSKKEGISYFLKAKELLESQETNLKNDWNYLSLLVIIGQSYTYINDFNSAKATYENILKLEPGFIYVRDELYPQLIKKMEN